MDPGESDWIETDELLRERATYALIDLAKDEPGVELFPIEEGRPAFFNGRVYDIVAVSKDRTVIGIYRSESEWHVVNTSDVKLLEFPDEMNRRMAIQTIAAGAAGAVAATLYGGYVLWKKFITPPPRPRGGKFG